MNSNTTLLNALTREGVLINVSVRYWRGTKKLKPEEIGLKASDVSDRLISLGHKRLLPKEALKDLALVEGRAHSLVESNTFPFLNGLGHFLPNARLSDVSERLKTLETDFWRAKGRFLDQYSTLRNNAADEWRRMAEKLVQDPAQLVSTIEAAFPMTKAMEKFFGFDVQLFQISIPEQLGIDLITLEDQRQVSAARDCAVREAADKIRTDTERFVADCVVALREQTAQLCDQMLNSINGSETGVHQKTLNRLVKFIDHFKQMNFMNDRVMEEQLEQVRSELLSRTAEEYRDSSVARTRLMNGLSQLANKAKELAHADATHLVERFGGMGKRKFILAA
jgi:hypothetical protein